MPHGFAGGTLSNETLAIRFPQPSHCRDPWEQGPDGTPDPSITL